MARVLIVDDEPLVRLSLRRALEKRGHAVTEAQDGREGLEAWKASRPELVYLDVLMPGLSGPDLLKIMNSSSRGSCKVILMSAFTGEYDLKVLGADQFILKPFEDIFSVVQAGEELIGGESARR